LLAAHLAGIRHWKDERTPALYATHFDNVSEILPLFKDDPLVAKPGTAYNYSSYGYNLLAVAIQAAAEDRYQSFVVRTILAPLGLNNTGFDDVRRVLPNRARRYSYYEPTTFKEDATAVYRMPDWDYSHNMGVGNMYATAEDLARFGRALMQPGFLSSRALGLLYTPARSATAESPWSFGWFVRKPSEGRRRIHITGSNAGLQTAVHVYPDDELVTVILSNTWGIGSRSGEMVTDLPEHIAAICMGWAQPRATPQ
jgi:CubicO group peptidase (beta-lactamase class C family)